MNTFNGPILETSSSPRHPSEPVQRITKAFFFLHPTIECEETLMIFCRRGSETAMAPGRSARHPVQDFFISADRHTLFGCFSSAIPRIPPRWMRDLPSKFPVNALDKS